MMSYSVFNPLTEELQLIPNLNSYRNVIAKTGLLVDHPNVDQYKLVSIVTWLKIPTGSICFTYFQ